MRLHAGDLDFLRIREEFKLPASYPDQALAEAGAVRDRCAESRVDATDIEFVTIDPPGAMDLDQAMHLEVHGDGHRVHYAIADLGALVEPGSELEAESLRRGQTFYLPDGKVSLHPQVLSEGLASLLPDQRRPAVLWTVDLDAQGTMTHVAVRRALVRSRARLDYEQVQADADAGRLHPSISELPVVGQRLREAGLKRGAIDLRLPAQEVARDGEGWALRIEPRYAADEWNAQISLLVGRAAAQIMVDGGVGLLRTLPPADAATLAALRSLAAALRLDWAADRPLGRFLDSLDMETPAGLAMMRKATSALRGASYELVGELAGRDPAHSGIAGPYAHVTAPIRRVCDRFTTEVCLALVAGDPVPDWAAARLGSLQETMSRSDKLAAAVDRACVDLAEAVTLSSSVGSRVEVVVLRAGQGGRPAEVWCSEPPVLGECTGTVSAGDRLGVRVVIADPVTRRITFAADEPDAGAVSAKHNRSENP